MAELLSDSEDVAKNHETARNDDTAEIAAGLTHTIGRFFERERILSMDIFLEISEIFWLFCKPTATLPPLGEATSHRVGDIVAA